MAPRTLRPDPGAAFDGAAEGYDAHFAHRPLGVVLRRRVWRWLDAVFEPGDRVLDVGCGTGEDALHLASRGIRVYGLDRSPAMVRRARAKTTAAGLVERVHLQVRDAADLADLAASNDGVASAYYDGALSNFGVLNCVTSLQPVARGLATLVRPGGAVLLVLMGRFCVWESLWFLAHRQPRPAVRRWRGHVTARVGGKPVAVRYPSPWAVRRTFAPWFQHRFTVPVGLALPPTAAADWAETRPGRLSALDGWDRRLADLPAAAWLADHYLLSLVRRAEDRR